MNSGLVTFPISHTDVCRESNAASRVIGTILVVGICAVLAFGVMAFGSAEYWAMCTLQVSSAALLVIWARRAIGQWQSQRRLEPAFCPRASPCRPGCGATSWAHRILVRHLGEVNSMGLLCDAVLCGDAEPSWRATSETFRLVSRLPRIVSCADCYRSGWNGERQSLLAFSDGYPLRALRALIRTMRTTRG